MILNISGRTDIVAFYTPWLLNRFKQGFFMVRNPFYPKQVSYIEMKDVDTIVFCTKNPIPIINHLQDIPKPYIFQVTLTGYHKDIEPGVPDKKEIIKAIQVISKTIGKDKVYVRYDPILINDKYTIEYHIRAFDKLCNQLNGSCDTIIISFIDLYKNVQKHAKELNLKEFTQEDYIKIAENFSRIIKENNMKIQTCFEDIDFSGYGFSNDVCVSRKLAFELTGKANFKLWSARNCGCVEMVDVGVYNTCQHFCKYCYANYDEKQIAKNVKEHDPHSPFLIGNSKSDDIIKKRKA